MSIRSLQRTSRSTLITATQVLLDTAEEAKDIPQMLPFLENVETALKSLTKAMVDQKEILNNFREQSQTVLQAQKELHALLVAFHLSLKVLAIHGNSSALLARTQLFPNGTSELTRLSGQRQRMAVLVFSNRLISVHLPEEMLDQAQKLQACIRNLSEALSQLAAQQIQKKAGISTLNQMEQQLIHHY